jgi:hypothetical protein
MNVRWMMILTVVCLMITLAGCSKSPDGPYALVSQESLLAFLEDLTTIQSYSGWRNSATEGEAEALDYVAETLGEFAYLQDLGVELERQRFRVFNSTELWETRLHLTVDGKEVEVSADGMRGHRDDNGLALRFDSDGELNDQERDPVSTEGAVALIRSASEIRALTQADLKDKIVFLDYAVIDVILLRAREPAIEIARDLLALRPAGLVLVTRFSNQPDESHGAFVGDGSAFTYVEISKEALVVPTLYVRLEDLAPAGIAGWDDLARVEAARLTWDTDVCSPGASGNLIARVPGADPSRAVILGAHIDSPNSPGGMDDGSGSVALLEVARVLNEAQIQPAVDLYLAWFGGHEIGPYGSSHFVATHQELLDRTLAMLQIDCLTLPLDGASADITLIGRSYGHFGDERLAWPDYLAQAAEQQGVETVVVGEQGVASGNLFFSGFDVPNANMIYFNFQDLVDYGNTYIHYAGHLHDPYETAELVSKEGDVLEQMTRVALAAALETGQDFPTLHATSRSDRRALFVGSHTEPVHMAPTGLTELGMALAWEGFDVDLIPYGQTVTPADLDGADLVVALPVADYASQGEGTALYDESWDPWGIAALEEYVAEGGLLVLTNSGCRLKHYYAPFDSNEDWRDVNELATHFGISYREGRIYASVAQVEGGHSLMQGVLSLELFEENGIPFTLAEGEVLAQANGEPVVALVDYGDAGGQVLVLADVGILGSKGEPHNLTFWQNLAQYARSR